MSLISEYILIACDMHKIPNVCYIIAIYLGIYIELAKEKFWLLNVKTF